MTWAEEFGWAPASLLGLGDYLDFFDGYAARCDKCGLHVQFSGFIITAKIAKGLLQNRLRSQIFLGDPEEEAMYPEYKIGPEPIMESLQLY